MLIFDTVADLTCCLSIIANVASRATSKLLYREVLIEAYISTRCGSIGLRVRGTSRQTWFVSERAARDGGHDQ